MNNVFGTLYFCNDSILRIRQHINGKIINYPLSDVQHVLGEPESFILQFLDRGSFIEEGTTLSNIILSLSPWKNILKYVLMVELEAYCESCFANENVEQSFSYLLIDKRKLIKRKFDNDMKFNLKKSKQYFENDKETELFEECIDYSTCGYYADDNEENNYSISDINFQKLKDTPVIISKNLNLIFFTRNKKPIFNEELKGVNVFSAGNERINVDSEFSFFEIINSIFHNGLFYEMPVSEEDENAYNEDIGKFITVLEDLRKNKAIEESENVIPLFKNKDENKPEIVYISDEDDEEDSKSTYNGFDDDVSEKIYSTLIGNSNIKIGDLKS